VSWALGAEVGDECPKCGKEMDSHEKDTSSGRDMRTYVCRPCEEYVDVDNGVALWRVLHDARQNDLKPKARVQYRCVGLLGARALSTIGAYRRECTLFATTSAIEVVPS
jgi:hypothetical protein